MSPCLSVLAPHHSLIRSFADSPIRSIYVHIATKSVPLANNHSQIDNLHIFDKFVRLLATRTGQLLNYNSIANDMGLSQPTIRKWISLLEASYIVFVLPPFFRNIGKRLIKTPKIYFYDVGLVTYLLEIENIQQLRTHPLRGNLFENFVIMEFLKACFNDAKTSNLYFYRDRTGNEIDLVLQKALSLIPVEVKSSETLNIDFSRSLLSFKKTFGPEIEKSFVIYSGKEQHIQKGITFLPWQKLSNFSEKALPFLARLGALLLSPSLISKTNGGFCPALPSVKVSMVSMVCSSESLV